MGPFEMIVAIVFIVTIAEVAKERGKGSKNRDLNIVLQEIRELKDEVRALRQQNNDVVLSLDSTVQRLDRRVDHLETRASLPAGEERAARLG
jgi:hypothetical protein